MKVNSRIFKIINFLKENNTTSIKEISLKLNFSERAIRYDIDNINYLLRNFNCNEIMKGQKGKISFKYDKRIEEVLLNLQDMRMVSYKERYNYLYFVFLFKGTLNLSELSRELDVSRVTISKDLKNIYNELEDKGFDIYNNTLLNTDEALVRNELISKLYIYFIEITKVIPKTLLERYLLKIVQNIDVSNIIKFIDNLIIKKNYNKFYDLIYSYILITCIRIKNSKSIGIQNESFLKLTQEYNYIKNNIFMLEKAFDIKFSKDEIINLTNVIIGIMSNLYNNYTYKNTLNLKILLKEMIENISKKTNINFNQDELLIERLYIHMKSCIYRMNNNLNIFTEVHIDEINDFPEILEVIKDEVIKLEEKLDIKFSEIEISFIAIHFISLIEKNREKKILKAILVCNGGYGTSILFKDKIEKNYNLKIIANISYLQLEEFNMKEIDLIISNIPLKKNYKKATINLNVFFKKNTEEMLNSYGIYKKTNIFFDTEKVYSLLNIIKENTTIQNEEKLLKEIENLFGIPVISLYNPNKINLFNYMTEENIRYLDKVNDWKESLQIVAESLLVQGKIKRRYIEEIVKVISSFGPYFVIRNYIAIPHGQIDENILNDGVSILYIKNGIKFPENKIVKLIILVASKNKNTLINTIKRINDISEDISLYQKLDKYAKKDTINFFKGE